MPDAYEIVLSTTMQKRIKNDTLLAFAALKADFTALDVEHVRVRVIVEIPEPKPVIRTRRTTGRENRKVQERLKEESGHLGALKAALIGLGLPKEPETIEHGFLIEATPHDLRSLCDSKLKCVGSIRYP